MFIPDRELSIDSKPLLRNLKFILNTPWGNLSNNNQNIPAALDAATVQAKHFSEKSLNKMSMGLYFTRGDRVRLNLHKIILNFIINTQLILIGLTDDDKKRVMSRSTDQLLSFLHDIYQAYQKCLQEK